MDGPRRAGSSRVRVGDGQSEGGILDQGLQVDPSRQTERQRRQDRQLRADLEYLEAAFHAAADAAGYADADIAAAAKTLAAHEKAHVEGLKKVLGKAAVKAPTVNTDTVGKLLADQNTFIETASMIEPVGTAAYAGAGPYLNNLGSVNAALSIHSVEANHAAYTSAIVKFKGIDSSAGSRPQRVQPGVLVQEDGQDRHRPEHRQGRPPALSGTTARHLDHMEPPRMRRPAVIGVGQKASDAV